MDIQAKTVGRQAEITIRNEGLEIPEGELANIFQKFYRLDAARSSRTGGAGLGLAIAKEIVDRHQGVLTLVDRPGPGLSVRMELKIEGPDHV